MNVVPFLTSRSGSTTTTTGRGGGGRCQERGIVPLPPLPSVRCCVYTHTYRQLETQVQLFIYIPRHILLPACLLAMYRLSLPPPPHVFFSQLSLLFLQLHQGMRRRRRRKKRRRKEKKRERRRRRKEKLARTAYLDFCL